MKDEIKEILDKMKDYSGECHSILAYSLCGYKKKIRGDFRMCMNDIDKLLDYITNLQEENKRLKELDENYPIEEQLEEALKYENIYKSRIDKALYFIDMDKHISTNWDNLTNKEKDEFMLSLLIELENILQGDDNE